MHIHGVCVSAGGGARAPLWLRSPQSSLKFTPEDLRFGSQSVSEDFFSRVSFKTGLICCCFYYRFRGPLQTALTSSLTFESPFLTLESRITMEKTSEILEEKKTDENPEVAELEGPESDEEQDVNAPDAAKKKKKKKKKAKKTGN